MIKYDTELFISKYKNAINKDVKIIGNYSGMNNKILCECLVCGEIYETTPSSLKQGCMHKPCASKIMNIKIGNTLTLDIVKERLEKINPKISIIGGDYVNHKSKLKCECLICGYKWKATSSTLLNKRGCPECGFKHRNESRTFTHKKFTSIMKDIDDSILFKTEYIKARTPITCECKKCGRIWESTPDSLMRGHGCQICSNKKTKEKFISEFNNKKTTLNMIDEYISSEIKMEFECKICGSHFNMSPHQFLKDFKYEYGCSKCNSSSGESKIISFLEENIIDYEWQVKYDDLFGVGGGLLSYDFYLKKYNLLIEFQGEQHMRARQFFGGEEAFKIQQEHDKRKREYAKNNDIKFLEIWYYDFDNIENILSEVTNTKKETL